MKSRPVAELTFPIRWVLSCWCEHTPEHVSERTGSGRGMLSVEARVIKHWKWLLNYKGNINRYWITLLIFIKVNQLNAGVVFLLFFQRLNVCLACKVKLPMYFFFSPLAWVREMEILFMVGSGLRSSPCLSWRNLNWPVTSTPLTLFPNKRTSDWTVHYSR